MHELNEHSSIKQYLTIQEKYFQEFLKETEFERIWPGREYYDHLKYKYAFLLKKLYKLKCTSHSILDVGYGPGVFDYILMKQGFNVTASDYFESENAMHFSKNTHIPYIKFNLNADERFQKTFDVVICSEVLEHTNINLKNGIKKLLTACHENSILIITLPNIYAINNVIRICQGINIVEDYPDEIVMKNDIILDMRCHKRECTKKDLFEAASANNLKLIEHGNLYTSTPFNHPFLAKIIPPPLRAHLYGIYTLS
ncbi:MAG: methyltransferase domain-containing protein [Methanomicrobiales archaeon]|jgi:2-polyprenyl-3-methyl-5-hydroxy-6-metoxy-1,4-benzoquinol methylase|nr:methyltransferase domain-containing protein [Methanomicrobiales archaeon]